MAITVSGPMTLVACPRDRTVVLDPDIHYRPGQIPGRHYLLTPTAPHPQTKPNP